MSRALRFPSHRTSRLAATAALFASAAALCLPAHALYKVVGPDGKVTYTDRPPVSKENKVQSVNTATGGVSTAGLPYELRQTVQRFPVTLYTGTECGPCDGARQLLRQRGVPFTERTVENNADIAALRRVTGKDDLPGVTIGSQVIVGYNPDDMTSYLDAAGYPKKSALPSNYSEQAATPLTPRNAPAAPAAAPAPAAPAPASTTDAPSGIRF
jgi:glutaredoxin